MSNAQIKPQELPRLLGYAELEAAYGWKKRSIQNAVARGELPRPMYPPGGKACWTVDQIEGYVRNRARAVAVSDPTQLADEDVPAAIQALAARHAATLSGEAVAPSDVTVMRAVGEGERRQMIEAQMRWVYETCIDVGLCLTRDQAAVVAYGLLPLLRDVLPPVVTREGAPLSDRDLRSAAIAAIDDALRKVLASP